jgi:hypothetical protein
MFNIKTVDNIIKEENERVWGIQFTSIGYIPRILRVNKELQEIDKCWANYVPCLSMCKEMNSTLVHQQITN